MKRGAAVAEAEAEAVTMTMTSGRIARRALLALPLLMLASTESACAPPAPKPPAVPPATKLALTPLSGLVKSPGLQWLVELRPREALMDDTWLAAVLEVVPDDRFRAFAEHNGKIDFRYLEELVVARYREATLVLGRGSLTPVALHEAFAARALHVSARAVDLPRPEIVRLVGERSLTVGGARDPSAGTTAVDGGSGPPDGGATAQPAARTEPVQLCTFGTEAFALETGRGGPLKVAELYALGKLHKSKPALLAEPLVHAAELLGPAAARFFVEGPFEGEWEDALGGLLKAATGIGVAVGTPARTGATASTRGHLRVSAVVLGAFDHARDEAARRFGASVDLLLSKNAIGRLCGLHEPVESPRVFAVPGGLRVDATFDAKRLASGLHQTLDAEISEIMKNSR